MFSIEQVEDLSDADLSALLAPLEAINQAKGLVWAPEALKLVVRDSTGTIAGGLISETQWGWLRITILAVDTRLQGQGWGRKLMLEAESIAIARGCHHAWVDTFSFQACPFYEKLGYRVFGTLPDYPQGETRYFLSKDLGPPQDKP